MNTYTSLPKCRILILLCILSFTSLTGAFSVSAQNIGDYGSLSTGSWLTSTIWGRWNGSSYVTDGTYPGQNLITPAPAVTIQAGHNVTANFTYTELLTVYDPNSRSITVYTTQYPIGKLTINNGTTGTNGGILTLPGTGDRVTLIRTPEIDVLAAFTPAPGTPTGTIYFDGKPSLALPSGGVIYVTIGDPGGLSGQSTNANQNIYIGEQWYAVGTSEKTTYNFKDLMDAGGSINAIINSPNNSTICQGTSISLQGSFSGTYGKATLGGISGVKYYWYDGTTLLTSGIITSPNTVHPEYNYILNTPGIHTLTFRVETYYLGQYLYYNYETRTITVRPTPTATINGTITVCQGATAPIITFINTQSIDETVTYNINGGANLTINVPANGTATVTPPTTTLGTFTYNLVSVKYQTGPDCSYNITGSATVTVNPNAAIALTSPPGTNAQTLCANTALTNITYSVIGGGTGAGVTGLPDGVTGSFNTGTFTISGTPSESGTFSYTVTTTGTCTQATATGTIIVNPNAAITLTSASETTSQTLCATTALTPITYSVTGGGTGATVTGLPTGVVGSFSGDIFTINGTPTESGIFNYTVTTTGTCTQATVPGTITVIPASVGGIATATKSTICYEYSTTITLTGHAGKIQWQQSADGSTGWANVTDGSGETSDTYTTPLLTTTTFYRAVVTSGSCTLAYSTVASVTITANMWEGTYSEAWENVTNWTCKIPAPNEDVTFSPSALNNLVVPDGDKIISNLTNNSNKALIIPTAKTLTIAGIATVNSPDRILIRSAAGAVNGSLIFTTPASNPNVPATVEMYSKAYKGAPQTFTDASGTYTVSYRWQYFGIPVQSAVYNATFEAVAPVSYVRVSNEGKNSDAIYYNEWDQLYNADPLYAFKGYEITQNIPEPSASNSYAGKTITFKGMLVTGDPATPGTQTLMLTKSGANPGSGSNIFGNSFTAAIDINKIVFNEPSKVDETVYLYNTGSLADWKVNNNSIDEKPGSFVAIPKVVSPVIQREIPSMQGFMLIASDATTVTIPYSAVLNNSVAQRVKPEDTGGFSYLTVDVIGKSDAERVWLFSQPETSHTYDNGWDGRKILPGGLTLYTDEMDEKLQVSTSDDLDGTYLALKAGGDTEYTLLINKSKLTGYKTLYLTDLETSTVTDLSALDEINYTFTATNSTEAVRRFLITSKDKKNNNGTKGPKVKIFNSGSTIRIDNPSDENGTVLIFDMFGQLRQTGVMNAASVTEITTGLAPSVYVVRVQAAGIDQSDKIVIRH